MQSRSLYRSSRLHITICDIEPSILARNALLIKLIVDNVPANQIWCLYFAQMIDDASVELLWQYANKLLEIGSDMSAWHASDIGKLVRFCDSTTYAQVRGIWALYGKGCLSYSDDLLKRKSLKEFRSRLMKGKGITLDTIAHIWPHGMYAIKDPKIHIKLAQEFSDEGSVPSCIDSSSTGSRNFFNPMILRGIGQRHELHFSLDPTMGFHKTMAYAKTLDGPLHAAPEERRGDKDRPDTNHIYTVCFRQFSEWCASFREVAATNLAVTYLHCGDAFAFCDSLAEAPESNSHALQSDVPRLYDVIDTSNVSDSTGLLNALLVTHRLLCPIKGVLFTGALNYAADDTKGVAGCLEQDLRVDLTTFMTLTNLNYIDSYNSQSSCYGDCMTGLVVSGMSTVKNSKITKSVLTMEWRIAAPPGKQARLRMSNNSFIRFCVSVYKNMFKNVNDDITLLIDALKMVNATRGQNLFAAPTIQTYVRFVAWIAQQVTDISNPNVFIHLLSALKMSGLAIQEYVQSELVLFMYRFGLIPFRYEPNGGVSGLYPDPTSHRESPYLNDSSPFYAITLLVPKKVAERLNKFPSTILRMGIGNNNILFGGVVVSKISLNMIFVKRRILPTDTDWEARNGDSNVVLKNFSLEVGHMDDYEYVAFSCFSIKSELVRISPENIFVWLVISTLHPNIDAYAMEFGSQLTVFKASLSDSTLINVQNLSAEEFCKPLYAPIVSTSEAVLLDATISSGGNMSEISCTLPFPAHAVCRTDIPSFSCPGHPFHLEMRLGDYSVQQSFPSGWDLARPLVQISRRSSYVKITLHPTRGRPPRRMFPVFLIPSDKPSRGTIQFWGLQRVILDSLPRVDLSVPESELQWLNSLAGAQMTQAEAALLDPPPLSSWKSTVHEMIINLCGSNPTNRKWPELFCLSVDRSNKIAVYINALRIDLTNGAVVLDLALCYLTANKLNEVLPLLFINEPKGVHSIHMTHEEHKWWKEAGPGLQERARDGWQHREDCEYFQSAENNPQEIIAPRQDLYDGPHHPHLSPICSCGCGEKSLHDTPFYRLYAARFPAAVAQFTRVAISPLYPIFHPHHFHGGNLKQQHEVATEVPYGPSITTTRTAAQTGGRQALEPGLHMSSLQQPISVATTTQPLRCGACHKQSVTLSLLALQEGALLRP